MALTRSKPATVTPPAEIVVSLMGFAWQPPTGHALAIPVGTALRADEPVVKAVPHYFAPQGLTPAEYGRLALAARDRRR